MLLMCSCHGVPRHAVALKYKGHATCVATLSNLAGPMAQQAQYLMSKAQALVCKTGWTLACSRRLSCYRWQGYFCSGVNSHEWGSK